MRSQYIPLFLIFLFCPVCNPIDFILPEITAEVIAVGVLVLYGIRRIHFSFNGLALLLLDFVLWYDWRMLSTASPIDGWAVIRLAGCLILYFYGRHICRTVSCLLPLSSDNSCNCHRVNYRFAEQRNLSFCRMEFKVPGSLGTCLPLHRFFVFRFDAILYRLKSRSLLTGCSLPHGSGQRVCVPVYEMYQMRTPLLFRKL